MQLQQFEQEILRLAFETDSRITTASVAYYLGIPSRDANQMLNALLAEGVLELDSDADGNLFYSVPNYAEEMRAITELKKTEAQEARTQAHKVSHAIFGDAPGRVRSPVVATASVEEDRPGPIKGVVVSQTAMVRVPPQPKLPEPPATPRDKWGGFDDYYGRDDGLNGGSQQIARSQPAWAGVVSRSSSNTDGTVGAKFESPFLVSAQARCEPKPLPDSRPVMASCAEPVAGVQEFHPPVITSDDLWFNNQREQNALIPLGDDTALAREYYIEQPEHQPGMALLLSLILCGTGQIYNGEVTKGIMMMVLCFLLWFVLLGWVVHIWSIVDAVVVAEKLNRTSEVPG